MTWASAIFFSCLAASPAVSASVSGRIVLLDSRAPEVRKHKDYSGVAAWLEATGNEPRITPPRGVSMLQKGKRFTPHVLVIPVGTSVEFPNLDPIFHNAFSNFSGQPFDTGLYPPGATQKVSFRRDGIVHVFCNIHSTMSAVIVVVKTPYYATTGQQGAFQIDNVPPGEYRLKIWHERATSKTLKALQRNILVPEEGLKLPLIQISESGYLEVPHLNKYGQEYPPPPPDRVGYPEGR